MEEQYLKRLYSPGEFYITLYHALRTAKYMGKSRRDGFLKPEFTERIMLAVTEVNGCEVCSYFHARMALESGISQEEVQSLLAGADKDVPPPEAPAILFAQHYADTRGKPSAASWDRITEEYGQTGALGILGAIRMIMLGNVYGIAFSALRRRFKGKSTPKSNLLYEIGMLLLMVPFLPAAAVHALFSALFKKPLITFK